MYEKNGGEGGNLGGGDGDGEEGREREGKCVARQGGEGKMVRGAGRGGGGGQRYIRTYVRACMHTLAALLRRPTDVWAHNEDGIAMCATIAAMRLRLRAWLR